MGNGVAAVLLDVDGTICEYRRSADDVLEIAFDAVGVDRFFGEREYLSRFADHAHEGDDIREVRRACFAAIATERDYDPDVGHVVADAYATERDHANVEFLSGARVAVEALGETYPLGVVTNGDPRMQSRKLDALGIADAFETVVHAGYDAAAKPDPEPFHLAIDEMGVAGGSAVHVGNSLISDVPGAQAAGLQAAWLDDGSDHAGEPDYVLDSMRDLHEPPWSR